MGDLHYFGLVRFIKKSGKIDLTMTALGRAMIEGWALMNTSKTKACVIVDIDERKVVSEYIGTPDGFPIIRKDPDEFGYDLPEQLFDFFEEEAAKRAACA